MKDIDKTEELLLSNKSLDDLIRMKIEQEMKSLESSKCKSNQNLKVSEISKVPKDLIFSKKSYFKIFNKNTKQESYINGLQADGLLGSQNAAREKILNGQCDVFATENAFVKFDYAEIS